ncbi:excalibur calcium-binding domain-containing protein [Arthrobacter sp. HMWF013]|uniref:excalibur calcium-binding domain-containing protein n=1 Tax=Arthrobacter sp. HMWF013 TaxID=2056849 RepID=UPI000D3A8AE9|nr:excalibur calcium-binding domain-containing protein [Arthrobacter sp. HMWF013]PTT66888.1 calcium-binding protein [Arthrobacter sp. HMWF013]
MKKTLTLVVLAGLMLTGCGGGKPAAQPAEAVTAVAEVVASVTVPGVLNLTLDKATDQLEDLGFKVEAVDTEDGKSILVEKNWQVTSQDPTGGASAAKGSTVHLGVKSLDKIAAEKAAAEKAAADKAAAEAAAAAKAAADKAAADKAAADQAAAQAAQQAAKAVPAPVAPAPVVPAPAPVVPAPAAVPFPNCTAARQAGAAPVYAGTPGYGKHLDRDGDGIGCDK